MSGICFAAGTICLVYYLILVIYAGITVDFSWIWLLTAFVLYGGGILIRYGKMHPGFFPGWLRYAAAFILIVGILAFSAICAGVPVPSQKTVCVCRLCGLMSFSPV